MKPQKIRFRVFLPSGLAVLTILALTVIGIYILENRNNDDAVREEIDELGKLFAHEVDKASELMNGLIFFIEKDKEIQKAWFLKDLDTLIANSSGIFNGILTDHKITHFYFHNLDQTCFLRVHKPTLRGDYIDRITLAQAIDTGKPAGGMEFGPFGTFTLRQVHPWIINNKIVGYIELGQEIAQIKRTLARNLDIELISILNKTYFAQEAWEAGQKMLGRNGDWDQFSNFVISSSTIQSIPKKIEPYLKDLESCEDEAHLSSIIKLSHNGREYRGGFKELIDAFDRDVGDFIILIDVTDNVASSKRVAIILTILASVIYGVLFGFFWFFLGRVENQISESISKMKTLQGLIPICSTCKKIRDDSGSWNRLENYLVEHSEAEFTHGICKDCMKEHYGEFYTEKNDVATTKKKVG